MKEMIASSMQKRPTSGQPLAVKDEPHRILETLRAPQANTEVQPQDCGRVSIVGTSMDPMNKPIIVGSQYPGQRAKKLFAIIAIDKDGNEGIAGMMTDIGMMPLVCEGESKLPLLKDAARLLADSGLNQHFELREYTPYTVLEVIK